MRRLRALTSILLVAGMAFAAAPAHASGSFTITPRSGDTFPNRGYLLSLPPGVTATADTLHVTENGGPVSKLQISALTDASQLGVVLVIDASDSMHGQPIAAAMQAARTFATHRDPKQPLSVVVFNSAPNVLLNFTNDQSKIDAALATMPTLGHGTHILDAVGTAEQKITTAGISSASIVVLSDGADTGSTASLADVTAAARAAHTRIFSVGLESSSFRPETLKGLASGGGGVFTAANSTSQLSSIYDRLGAQLANQYLVTYQSLASADAKVDASFTVDGLTGAQSVSYIAPPLTRVASAPYHRSTVSRLLSSWVSALIVALIGGLLAALAVITIVQPRSRALRRRMRPFVPETESEADSPAITDAIYESAERALSGTRWWDRFAEDVELARISMTAGQAVVLGIVGGLLLGVVLSALTGSWVMLIFAPLVPIVGRVVISLRADKQRYAFATQLPDNLQVLASALRAGHSLLSALAVMTDDSAEPSRTEFKRLIGEERVGVPIDTSLAEISRRMQSREVMQIALVTVIQQQTGGNTAEILDQIAINVRARFELRRLVKTLTAQGRTSRWIVTALPVFLFLIILTLNPGYVRPLLHSTLGQVLMLISAGMTVLGSLVISKIVTFEV